MATNYKYMSCRNVDLLKKYNVDLLCVHINNTYRYIDCNGVYRENKYDSKRKLTNCNVQYTIKSIPDYTLVENVIKTKSNLEETLSLEETQLYIYIDKSFNLILDERKVPMLEITNQQMIFKTYNYGENIDIKKILNDYLYHKSSTKIPNIKNKIKLIYEFFIKNNDDNIINSSTIFYRFYNSTSINSPTFSQINIDDINNYNKFFKKAINTPVLAQDIMANDYHKSPKIIKDIFDFLNLLNIPRDFLNYIKMPNCNFYNYCYNCYNSPLNNPLNQWYAIPDNLRNTITSLIEHNILSTKFILKYTCPTDKIDKKFYDYLNDFISKYSIIFGDKVLDEFISIKEYIEKEHLSYSLFGNIKNFTLMKAMKELDKKGYSMERINAFGNIFEEDPQKALEVLLKKKSFTKEELKSFSNIKNN